MKKILQILLLSSLVISSCLVVSAYEPKISFDKKKFLPKNITQQINKQFPDWQIVTEEDVLPEDKGCLNDNKYDGLFVGYFNKDNKKDYIIQLKYHQKYITLAFITQHESYKQFTLETYKKEKIVGILSLAKKGESYYDHDKEKSGIYHNDAIMSLDCDAGGYAYIFSNGHFKEICISD